MNLRKKKSNPAAGGQSGSGAVLPIGTWDCQRQQNFSNHGSKQSPQFLQSRLAFDDYRLNRLPTNSPRRTPTLAKVSFLDDWSSSCRIHRSLKKGRQRFFMPYGVWTCADGRQVIFNRDYLPIWERRPGELAKEADPTEWVPWTDQVWFFNDGTTPLGRGVPKALKQASLEKINKVLCEWGIAPVGGAS